MPVVLNLALNLPAKHLRSVRIRDRGLLLGVLVVAIVACAAFWRSATRMVEEPVNSRFPLSPDEPRYSGHPLSYWVFVERRPEDPLSSHMESDLDAPGKAAVRRAGAKAIPFLLRWISLEEEISLENGDRAAWAFGALGRLAEPAIPALARMATYSDRAIEALGRIGPRAIPALSALATNRTVRRVQVYESVTVMGINYLQPVGNLRPAIPAIMALVEMGTNAMAAVPVFIECLRDDDPEVVIFALSALRGLKPHDEAVLVAERGVLSSTNVQVRRSALFGLATFGEKSLPDILRTLEDPDAEVVYAALGIVCGIAPQTLTNATVLAGAAEGLRSPDRNRQRVAAQTLRAAGQWAQGKKVDLSYPVPGGWDAVFHEATNALQRLLSLEDCREQKR